MALHKTGDWEGLQAYLRGSDKAINKGIKEGLARSSEYTRGYILRRIQSQPGSWKPLNPNYLRWKKRKGYSTKIWVQTSSTFQSVTRKTYRNKAIVGINRSVVNKQGDKVFKIGQLMEFGSSTTPARPLFKPARAATLKYIRKSKVFDERINFHLRRLKRRHVRNSR